MTRIAADMAELAREQAAPGLLGWAERGLLPDALIRHGIRRQCEQRLQQESSDGLQASAAMFQQRIDALRASPVAIHTDAANAQHYELPPEFFQECLVRVIPRRECAGAGAGAVRPLRVGRDVRAHAQLRDAAGADRRLAASGRQTVRAHLLPPHADVSLRDPGRGQRGGGISSPAA